MKRPEDNCTNCRLRPDCRFAQGAVTWKHCERFRLDVRAVEAKKIRGRRT